MKQKDIHGNIVEMNRWSEGLDITDEKMKNISKTIPLKQSQIEKTYKKLKLEERKVMKDLLNEVELMEKHKQNVNELKKTILRIQSYIKWGFDEVDLPINLDCVVRGGGGKKVKKGNEYIRGRVHWDGGVDGKGGLREINDLGRISKLVDNINECIRNGVEGFPKDELSDKLSDKYKSMSWSEIEKNRNLMKLLRLLSKNKFRNQLHKQFLSRRTLGMRIRTKDMKGVHRVYDKNTLMLKNKPNHIHYDDLDKLIEREKENSSEKFWYKNVSNWLKDRKNK
jgi:hypothetical protein